jgi:hypothetical protein
MTFDYARSQATALRLLGSFGQAVTRRTVTAGAYAPSTGTATVTTADTTRTGAVLDYSDQSKQGERYIRGNLVKGEDRQLLLDGTGPAELTDRYVIGGTEYSVVSVSEISPAGTIVMFDIHLRRA